MDKKHLEELLNQIKLDNKIAFGELYDLIHQDVFKYVYSIVNCKEYAQDLTHDVFVHIYRNARMYNQKGHPMAWIMTISRNITYMSLRKSNREIVVDFKIDKEFCHLNHIHDRILIEKMMTSLSNEEREIIVLHIVEGLTFHEISKILNLRLSTTLSKYHRSLKKLRENMEV